MIPPPKKLSPITKWFQQGKAPLLKELLSNPLMKEAWEIIMGHAEPNDAILPQLCKDHGVNAPMVISIIHATQAGERRIERMFKRLSEPSPEDIQNAAMAAPFEHIDEKYLEQI